MFHPAAEAGSGQHLDPDVILDVQLATTGTYSPPEQEEELPVRQETPSPRRRAAGKRRQTMYTMIQALSFRFRINDLHIPQPELGHREEHLA